MQLTISKKLYGLGLLGLVFTLAVGLTGAWGITRVAAGIDDVGRTSAVVRDHIQASIFVDWSRADVSKMLTTSGDSQDTAASQLADHLRLLKSKLSEATSLEHDPAIQAALDQEDKVAEQYVANAGKISGVRAQPAQAMQVLGPFLRNYQDLLNMMDATNDKLQAESRQTESQARIVVQRSHLGIIVFCIASSVFLFAIAFGITRQINRRLAELIRKLKHLAAGDLTQQVLDTRRDELAEIAHWFNDSVEKLRGTVERVASSADSVTSAVEDLNAASQLMSANSEETTAQANVVSMATSEVTRTLQTVATSTEEMNSSIKEITKNVGQAATVAAEAVQIANSANSTVSRLGDSSMEIGAVIKVITSIAQQTNLLALNATIEAARAGEAGKGFAVVANEVKELATQTAKATEDIGQKIGAIQLNTKESVDAIAKIGEIIVQINDISGTISNAMQEQHAVTNLIAQSVSEGAKGSSEIAANISSVAQAAQSTSLGANHVRKATGDLQEMSSRLKQIVGQFKYASERGSNGDSHPPEAVIAHLPDRQVPAPSRA